jgi:uncharacterized protein (DUF305 family)
MNKFENIEQYILLDNLFNIYIDAKYDDDDEALLKEEKFDVNQVVQKNIMLFRQLRTKAKAELNQAKHNRVKEFLSKIKSGIESNIEEYKKIADEIFSKPKFAELQPMFRNLNEVTEQDKKSILLDSKLLDLLAEIEEEHNNGLKNE